MLKSIIKSGSLLLIVLFAFAVTVSSARGQDTVVDLLEDDSGINRARLTSVAIVTGVAYTGTMIGLYELWYKGYPQSSFHFINDNNEWLFMDKVGHTTTTYWLGRIGYHSLKWSGVKEKTAVWIGGGLGFAFVTTIEAFDGFSAQWGASMGDVLFNTAGAALFMGQQLVWEEQKFMLKFSYSPTQYPQYNPGQLGSNQLQEIFKDYNGQTYWLSGNIKSFLKEGSGFPGWLNVAFGYGAEGMTGASANPGEINGSALPNYERRSQYYLTLDIDLTRIKTRSETARLLLNLIGFVKIPFPTLEYNRVDGLRYHWLYF